MFLGGWGGGNVPAISAYEKNKRKKLSSVSVRLSSSLLLRTMDSNRALFAQKYDIEHNLFIYDRVRLPEVSPKYVSLVV
jgi:hypothetical protein